jgi:hypothetical protein
LRHGYFSDVQSGGRSWTVEDDCPHRGRRRHLGRPVVFGTPGCQMLERCHDLPEGPFQTGLDRLCMTSTTPPVASTTRRVSLGR